jgi:hypothetical protein
VFRSTNGLQFVSAPRVAPQLASRDTGLDVDGTEVVLHELDDLMEHHFIEAVDVAVVRVDDLANAARLNNVFDVVDIDRRAPRRN